MPAPDGKRTSLASYTWARLGKSERCHSVSQHLPTRPGNFFPRLSAGSTGARAGTPLGLSSRLQYDLHAALL